MMSRAPYLFPKAGRLREASVRFLAGNSSGVIVTGPGDRAAFPDHPHICEIPVGSNILAPLTGGLRPCRHAGTIWRRR